MTMAAYDARIYQRLRLDPAAGRAAFEMARSARLAAAVNAARALSPFYRRRADWPEEPCNGTADLPRLTPETMAQIRSIYEKRIKPAVHQRW